MNNAPVERPLMTTACTTHSNPPWRALVVNGTFLEVLADHRAAMEALGFAVFRPADLGLVTTEEILRQAAGMDVVFGPGIPFDAAFFAMVQRLKIIAIAASGYEGVDLDAATRAGVAVTNAPTQLGSAAVADVAFGLMLAVARSIPHLGNRCAESVQNVMRATIEQAHTLLSGGRPQFLLNPEVLAIPSR